MPAWRRRPLPRQAGYEAPDDNWSLGALQRVDLLISNLGKGKNITPAKVVSAMNEAATQDVREMTFEPVLSKLLHGGKAPNAATRGCCRYWTSGASRAVAAWTAPTSLESATSLAAGGDHGQVLAAARQRVGVVGARLQVVGPVGVVREPVRPAARWPVQRLAHLHGQGLRTMLNMKVRAKYNVRYCGAGNVKRCRSLLWKAMDTAGKQLAKSQGSSASPVTPSRTRDADLNAPPPGAPAQRGGFRGGRSHLRFGRAFASSAAMMW
jgi:hypothetical protein